MKKIRFTLNDSRNRLLLLGGLILLMFFAVAVKLLWIQIVSGTELGKRATVQVTDKIRRHTPGGGSWTGTGKSWLSASWCIPCMLTPTR